MRIWLVLGLVLLIGSWAVEGVNAQTENLIIRSDELRQGSESMEYVFSANQGQMAVISLTSERIDNLILSAPDHVAATVDPPSNQEILVMTVESNDLVFTVQAVFGRDQVPEFPLPYTVQVWLLPAYSLPSPCEPPSSIQAGDWVTGQDPVQLIGDPYVTAYMQTMNPPDFLGSWLLRPIDKPFILDPQQPMLIAEGPACVGGIAYWRVRATTGSGETVHFWTHTELTQVPSPVLPTDYIVPITVLKPVPDAPLINAELQLSFGGQGGGAGVYCISQDVPDSRASLHGSYAFAVYTPFDESPWVQVFTPDGSLYKKAAMNQGSLSACIPLREFGWSTGFAWNAPPGIWRADITTSTETRHIAFEVVPQSKTLSTRRVCVGLQEGFLVGGLQPHETVDVVWVGGEFEDKTSESPLNALTEMNRWTIQADEYGNAMLQPLIPAERNDRLIFEFRGYRWQEIMGELYGPNQFSARMLADPSLGPESQIVTIGNLFDRLIRVSEIYIEALGFGCPPPSTLNVALANTIPYGGKYIGEIINDETYYFAFQGEFGQVIDAHAITVEESGPDLELTLLDENGTQLAFNDDAENVTYGFFDPRIEDFQLPADGVYILAVHAVFGKGSFVLSME